MEKKPSKAFETWLQAAKDGRESLQKALLPYGTYSWGAVEPEQFEAIKKRFEGVPIPDNKRAALIEQATDFYVSCRERKASPLHAGQLIDLHRYDPSIEASDKYFGELVKADPASNEGKIIADYLSACKGDQVALMGVGGEYKAMYDAILKEGAVNSVAPPRPPKLKR